MAFIHYLPPLGGFNHTPKPRPFLEAFFSLSSPVELVLDTGLQETELRYPLSIWYLQSAFDNHSPLNSAISGLLRDRSHAPWYGTVVVLKYSGRLQTLFTDIQQADLTTLTAYFLDLV